MFHEEVFFILNTQAVDYERRSTYSLAVEVQNPNVDSRFLRRGPFKDRGNGAHHGSERRRAAEVSRSRVPAGCIGKLPSGMRGGKSGRRGPGYRPQ